MSAFYVAGQRNHRTKRALNYFSRLGGPMSDNDPLPDRQRPCQIPTKGTASVVSIGSSLRAAFPINKELEPDLQAALKALIKHS